MGDPHELFQNFTCTTLKSVRMQRIKIVKFDFEKKSVDHHPLLIIDNMLKGGGNLEFLTVW